MSDSDDQNTLSPQITAGAWSVWGKRVGLLFVNAWLGYHLCAIVICPASVSPATPLAQSAWTWVSGYVEFLYLNHGFHFFAPDPSGSNLVQYTLSFPDGRTRTERIPNRDIQPRLLYHRYFMLTERLGNSSDEERPLLERAMARQLIRTTGAEKVQLELIFHDTAAVADIREGIPLTDSKLFTEEILGSYSLRELNEPYLPPVLAPAAPEMAEHDPLPDATLSADQIVVSPATEIVAQPRP